MKRIKIWFLAKLIAFAFILFIGYKSFLYAPSWFDVTVSSSGTLSDIAGASADELDSVNQNGQTGLMIAAAHNDADQAQAFVDAGANVRKAQERDYKGNTAWHFAILMGAKNVIPILITAGVPLWLPNTLGERASHTLLAIFNFPNDPLRGDMADLLFGYGMQWNLQNQFGNTMLHDAAQIRDRLWIEWVMSNYGNYIDLSIKNNEGQTAEDLANALGRNDDMNSVLTSLQTPYKRVGVGQLGYQDADQHGTTALMFAIYKGDIAKAKEYIQNGAVVYAANDAKETALHMAMISMKPVAAVRTLLEAGASPNAIDRMGRSPLNMLYLVEQPEDRLSILDMLVKKGADLNHADNDGITIARRAKQQRDVSLTQALEHLGLGRSFGS